MSADHTSLSALVELSGKVSDGVILFDSNEQKITHINGAARMMTGLKAGSTIDDVKGLLDTMPADDLHHLMSHVKSIKSGMSLEEIEFRMFIASSPVNLCASTYSIQDGRYTVVFLRDITKSKTHEGYLIEFGTKKNTTLDGVVHFMSGALTLMRNLSIEASKLTAPDTSTANSYLELIAKNSSHCLDVVKDLLQEEHDKSPDISVKRSRVNVTEKVGYIVNNLKSAYPSRHFKFSHPHHEIMGEIDEIKVLQIINNLAFNAIKFSKPESTVTIGVVDTNYSFSIYVADSGIGIPAALQPHIFDRDTIAGRKGLNGEESFGKGLFICKRLASMMQGTLSFESEEGKGSIFYITLPIREKTKG